MLRSQYTEVYPRKFARLVAKTWNHAQHTWPFRWQYGMLLAEKAQEVPVLAGKASPVIKFRAFRSRTNFVKSQLLTPVDNREGSAKRRRLDGKQSSPVDLEVCQNLFHDLQNFLPRVGRREIQDSSMLQKLQQVIPDKTIVTAIACRGTDRTLFDPSPCMLWA
jgi:Tfp pilus assembly protein PilN